MSEQMTIAHLLFLSCLSYNHYLGFSLDVGVAYFIPYLVSCEGVAMLESFARQLYSLAYCSLKYTGMILCTFTTIPRSYYKCVTSENQFLHCSDTLVVFVMRKDFIEH